jgi:hypothetical protein
LVQSADKEFQVALKEKQARIMQAIFSLFREFVLVVHDASEYMDKMIPHIIEGMKAKGDEVVIVPDALSCMDAILELHDFKDVKDYVKEIAKAALACVESSMSLLLFLLSCSSFFALSFFLCLD